MHWRLAFPHNYIGAPDLKGRDVSLTISDVRIEDLSMVEEKDDKKRKQERKMVLYFEELKGRGEGEPRMMVCNKTNAKTIAKLHGPELTAWRGKRITLYPTTCLAFGERVECVRIREKAPPPKRGKAAEPAPEQPEESA